MSFFESALGSGAAPLIVIDGPVAEIKRHIRAACGQEWVQKAWEFQPDPKLPAQKRPAKVMTHSLGFGLTTLAGAKHPLGAQYDPDTADDTGFAGPEGRYNLLDWIRKACNDAIGNDHRLHAWFFLFDLDHMANDRILTSQLAYLTDPEGLAIRASVSIVLCGPGLIYDLPPELQDQAIRLRCPLPTTKEIKGIFTSMYSAAGETPEAEHIDRLSRAATGITAAQVQNLAACSLYQHSEIKSDAIWQEVQNILSDLPGVTLLDTDGYTLESISGYKAVKNSAVKLIEAYEHKPKYAPKGILLFGPPGTGKSAVMRAVGAYVGWKVILVSPNEFKDKYVGETGKNMSKLIALAEALAPCIIILDEVDGAFGSSSASKESDSSGDMLTILLTWMAQPRKKPIFMAATCNRLDKLPPEFARAGRFDKRFFMDVPTAETRKLIWAYYIKKYGLNEAQVMPNDTDWTGAEIESCVQIAYLEDLSLVDAAKQVVPVVNQMGANFLFKLRDFAAASCLDSETGERYRAPTQGTTVPPPPLPAANDTGAGGLSIKKKGS